jgi:hypothetical protein
MLKGTESVTKNTSHKDYKNLNKSQVIELVNSKSHIPNMILITNLKN